MVSINQREDLNPGNWQYKMNYFWK